jgi:hypothetical protein
LTQATSAWDVTALINAADPKAALAERHLWLVRLTEWLRHAPSAAKNSAKSSAAKNLTPHARPCLCCACATC